jgi:abnormal spindle-like microcephaly-associated protein
MFVNDIISDTYIKADTSCNEIELIITDQKSFSFGKTHVISTPPLISITEEDSDPPNTASKFQRTFKVNEKCDSLENIPVITEFDCEHSRRRIMSESMQEKIPKTPDTEKEKLRSNQGSMPNLNEMDSSMASIEHNRYFFQEKNQQNLSIASIASNADFRETEICAQSSRFNLNEIGLSSNITQQAPRPTFSPSKMQKANVKNRDSPIRSNDNATALHQSPTIRRVRQDSQFKSPLQRNVQMTFSPPQRSKLSIDIREMQRRETFIASSRGQEIRVTAWKQQQAQFNFQVPRIPRDSNTRPSLTSQSLTSLSTLSLASASSTCSMPANITQGKLYNEQNMSMYNNPDPFAATTTADPFLSSTMFLDERSVDQIEKVNP